MAVWTMAPRVNPLSRFENFRAPVPINGLSIREKQNSLRAILSLLALTFIWTWGLGFLATQVNAIPALSATLRVLAGFGPSMAGIIVVARAGNLREWLARCLNGRVRRSWYVLAFLIPPVLMIAAIGLDTALGGAAPARMAAGKIPLAVANFGLVFLVGGPLGEEFGWRGYLTPALTARMGWRPASMVVGVIWGVWHLPLFFSAGTVQASMAITTFMLNTIAGSVLFGWLFNRTRGTVLPGLVLHTSLNAWAGILAIIPSETVWRPYVIVTGLLMLVALALLTVPDRQ